MLEKEYEELLMDSPADHFLYELTKKTGKPLDDMSDEQILQVISLWKPDAETRRFVEEQLQKGNKKELLKLLTPEKYYFSSGSSVSISKSARYVRSNDFHEHDYFEIECILDGAADHHSVLGDYRLEKNDITLIPPHVKHDLDVIERGTVINLGIRSSTFRTEFKEILQRNVGIASYFEKIMYGTFNSEVIIRNILDEFMIELILMLYQKQKDLQGELDLVSTHLITCFIYHMFEKTQKELVYDISRSSDILASQMKKYIYEHCADVDLDSLSDHFYLSSAHTSRYLKQQLHVNYSDIVKEARMEKAKELLVKTDRSVLEISQEVGYSSQSHFIQVFHKLNGTSPLRFRSKLRNG